MKKSSKSKWFIIITFCIIISTILIFLLVDNKLNTNKEIVATDINKNELNSTDTDKKQIYNTYDIETSWVKDPNEPKNLLEISKDNSIIKVKVKSIRKPTFLEKTTDFYDSNPFTPVEVIIEQLLDGQPLNNINTIYLRGGDVKISELIQTIDQETIKKMRLDTLTKEQKDTMYISYKSDYDYNLKPDEEYVLIVAKNSNNIYSVVANGYGIFKEDKKSTNTDFTSSESVLKNVLTNKDLTDKNGAPLTLK